MCKNYRAKLESIVQEHPRYKGRGGLTQKVIRRLTAAARAAIRMHSATGNVDQLRKDLRHTIFLVTITTAYLCFAETVVMNPTV